MEEESTVDECYAGEQIGDDEGARWPDVVDEPEYQDAIATVKLDSNIEQQGSSATLFSFVLDKQPVNH